MQGIQFSANSSLTERLTLGNKLAIMQITVKVFVLNVTWEHSCEVYRRHHFRLREDSFWQTPPRRGNLLSDFLSLNSFN